MNINKDFLLENYDFTLPHHLIATHPVSPKEDAKLLVYHNKEIIHTTFHRLFDFIPKDYLIILNNTKVINARFFAAKLPQQILESSCLESQQYTKEIFYHKALTETTHLVQIRGKAKLYDCFTMQYKNENICIQIVDIQEGGYKVVTFFPFTNNILQKCKNAAKPHQIHTDTYLTHNDILDLLEEYGKVPLPPYIKRQSNEQDTQDYQSIFAKTLGSVAAPTASLHFSESMFTFLQQHYDYDFVTLHIGAGTFKPVTTKNILEHNIHTEYCTISQKSAQKISNTQNILCIGTTAMRSVEWFIHTQKIFGENNIFLHPGNQPKKIKALLTNFHLPKSSLLMLVSSIIGRKQTLKIYQEAIRHNYRFYSYGDGMLII